MADPSSFSDRLQEQHQRAKGVAETLPGLPFEEASRRAEAEGFHIERLTPDITVVTMDFRADRIRLYVDDDDKVVRATAG